MLKRYALLILTLCIAGCFGPYEKARKYFLKGEKETEISGKVNFYQKSIQTCPEYLNSYWRLAEIYSEQNDYATSISYWNKVLELVPGWTKALYNTGRDHWLGKDWKTAIDYLTQVINTKSANWESFYLRGSSFLQIENPQKALLDFEKTNKINPDSPTVLFWLGHTYLLNKQNEKALTAFTDALVIQPDWIPCLINKGIALYHLEKWKEALAEFDKIINKKPKAYKPYYLKALTQLALNKPESAFENLSNAIKNFPDHAPLYAKRAEIHFINKNFSEALQDYAKVLQINSRDSLAIFMSGKCLFLMNQTEETKKFFISYTQSLTDPLSVKDLTFKKAYSLDNSQTRLLPGLSELFSPSLDLETVSFENVSSISLEPEYYDWYRKRKEDDTSYDMFKSQDDLSDDFFGLKQASKEKKSKLAGLSIFLILFPVILLICFLIIKKMNKKPQVFPEELFKQAAQEKTPEKQIVLLSEAIEVSPFFQKAYYKRALLYKSLNEFHAVINDCDKLIRLDGNNGEYYRLRGVAKKNLNEAESAREDFKKANELKDSMFYVAKGIHKIKQNEFEEAILEFDIAIEKNSEQATAYANRGIAKVYTEDIEGAITDYSKAIELEPCYINAYKNRAQAYEKLGNQEAAEADLAKATEIENQEQKHETAQDNSLTSEE